MFLRTPYVRFIFPLSTTKSNYSLQAWSMVSHLFPSPFLNSNQGRGCVLTASAWLADPQHPPDPLLNNQVGYQHEYEPSDKGQKISNSLNCKGQRKDSHKGPDNNNNNEMKIPREETVYIHTWPYLDSNSNWLKTKQAVRLKAFTNKPNPCLHSLT